MVNTDEKVVTGTAIEGTAPSRCELATSTPMISGSPSVISHQGGYRFTEDREAIVKEKGRRLQDQPRRAVVLGTHHLVAIGTISGSHNLGGRDRTKISRCEAADTDRLDRDIPVELDDCPIMGQVCRIGPGVELEPLRFPIILSLGMRLVPALGIGGYKVDGRRVDPFGPELVIEAMGSCQHVALSNERGTAELPAPGPCHHIQLANGREGPLPWINVQFFSGT